MAERLENPVDVERHYNGTIVMYDGRPFYSKKGYPRNVRDDLARWDGQSFDLYDLTSGMVSRQVSYLDDNFTTEIPPLGYLNTDAEAFLISRRPVRRTKSGLYDECLRISAVGCRLPPPRARDLIVSRQMYNMLMDIYQTQDDAYMQVYRGERNGAAFAKAMAYKRLGQRKIGLYYYDVLVGTAKRRRISLSMDKGLSVFQAEYRSLGFDVPLVEEIDDQDV